MSHKNLHWTLTTAPEIYKIGNTFTDTVTATERGWERVRAVTGTVSSTGTAVTGSGTLFTTELRVGSFIIVGTQVRTVATIADDTHLTTDVAFSPALSSSTLTKSMEVLIAIGLLLDKEVDALVIPTFTLAVPSNGNKVTGSVLTFTVAPSEAVQVIGLPTIAVTIGSNVRLATFDPVSSTSTALVFKYTVVASDVDTNGIAVANVITLGTTDEIADQVIGGGAVAIPSAALTFTVPSTTGITVN